MLGACDSPTACQWLQTSPDQKEPEISGLLKLIRQDSAFIPPFLFDFHFLKKKKKKKEDCTLAFVLKTSRRPSTAP